MTRKVIAAGFTNVFYGILDANGQCTGVATSLNAGVQAGSSMRRFEGAKSGPISVPTPDVVMVTGDDEAKGSFTFDSTDLANGTLTTSIKDMDFEALCMGLEVVDLGVFQTVGIGQPENPQRRDMCMILQRRAKSRTAAEIGVGKWEGIFIPKATITPLYAPFQERTPAEYGYQLTLNKSDSMIWGETFGLSTWGAEEMVFHQFNSDNPIVVHAFRGNGAQTVFNLDYTPAGTTAAYVRAYVNRVHWGNITVNAAAKTVTFGAAPTNGAIGNIVYQYTT